MPTNYLKVPVIFLGLFVLFATAIETWAKDIDARGDHWAYQPLGTSAGISENPNWGRNGIDQFVFDGMAARGMKPAPEANRYALLRRLSLALTGLPPTPESIRSFVEDDQPGAYERVVERLLASPHFGERQAIWWLDGARYADTNGYEKDRHRDAWPYRDWVIEAFNADMPYDAFAVRQIAGDLLPEAADSDRIATGFLRNSLLNEEGGVDVEEFRYEAVVDRTNTISSVFMGLTMSCAQCHDHKYDPFSQREYFEWLSFFDNTDDVFLPVEDAEIAQEREEIESEIAEAVARFEPVLADVDRGLRLPPVDFETARLVDDYAEWTSKIGERAVPWRAVVPESMESERGTTLTILEDGTVLASGNNPNKDVYEIAFTTASPSVSALRLDVLTHPSLPNDGPGRGVIMEEGDFFLSEIEVYAGPIDGIDFEKVELDTPSASYAANDRGPELALDGSSDTGWSVKERPGEDHSAVFPFAKEVDFEGGARFRVILDQNYIHNHTIGRFRLSITDAEGAVEASGAPFDVESIFVGNRMACSPEDEALARQFFLEQWPHLLGDESPAWARRQDKPEFNMALIVDEREDVRTTRIHERGEFLRPGDTVSPGVPEVLPSFPEKAPRTRLEAARWLVNENRALTSRVMVNRVWQQLFGRGLVETPDDFGSRGSAPTHPELLDWLAAEFIDRGWSVKELFRLVVTSATYRQQSSAPAGEWERDPQNKWLARGPRFRVDAEIVRDIALASSGLLEAEIGGPSAFPPLPEALIDFVYAGSKWKSGDGADEHRRGLYTYWKRTLPYPSATVFDAPPRDTACLRRNRSNTPLQALTLLNDPVFVEAADAMAERVCAESGDDFESRLRYAFLLTLSRPPDAWEVERVLGYFDALDSRSEMERWSLICRSLLNLDETITSG